MRERQRVLVGNLDPMGGGFSLRTLMLTIFGFSLVCALFSAHLPHPALAHTLLVLAFAIPGGSYGYDVRRSSRGIAVGTCVAAVAGTVLVCAMVLIVDWWLFF